MNAEALRVERAETIAEIDRIAERFSGLKKAEFQTIAQSLVSRAATYNQIIDVETLIKILLDEE